MVVENCECIGGCNIDKDGNIIELQRGFFRQGWIFKDWEAFKNRPDDPCYVPELVDTVYTRNDFMTFCNNQEEIAEELFNEVDWQGPSALMNEWKVVGEVDVCEKCGKLFMVYDVEKCPHCGTDIPEE